MQLRDHLKMESYFENDISNITMNTLETILFTFIEICIRTIMG